MVSAVPTQNHYKTNTCGFLCDMERLIKRSRWCIQVGGFEIHLLAEDGVSLPSKNFCQEGVWRRHYVGIKIDMVCRWCRRGTV